MKNRLKRTLAILISMMLLITSIPITAFGNTDTDYSTQSPTNQTISNSNATILAEITDKRTEYSKTYLLETGEYIDVYSPTQVHKVVDGNLENISNELDGTPSTVQEATNLISTYALTSEVNIANEETSTGCPLIFNACNDKLSFYECSNINTETANTIGISEGSVFAAKINDLHYSSENKIVNSATLSFDFSWSEEFADDELQTDFTMYYGDNAWQTNSSVDIYSVEENEIVSSATIETSTTNISYNILDLLVKWDRNEIENSGIYFANASDVAFNISNPVLTISYQTCGYNDINYTYHSIDLGDAGEILINDYTNTITLEENIAGINVDMMPVQLKKYCTSADIDISNTAGYISTLNYNSKIQLYDSVIVWIMFDGSEKKFVRPENPVISNNLEIWEEIESTQNTSNTAKLYIDPDIVDYPSGITDYSSCYIEYGTSKYTFDSNGYINKIESQNNNIDYSFSNGSITQLTDGNGNQYKLSYSYFNKDEDSGEYDFIYLSRVLVKDSSGNTIQLGNSTPYIVNISYLKNEDGCLQSTTTYPDNKTLVVNYDTNNRISSVIYNDITTSFTYEENQNFIKSYVQNSISTDGNVVTIESVNIDSSDTYRRIFAYLDNKSEIIDFNNKAKAISNIDKDGNLVCFNYDQYGNLNSYAVEETTNNLIKNGNMDNGKENWSLSKSSRFSFDKTNGVVTIDSTESDDQYMWQSLANLETDKTYVLSFSGKCEQLSILENAFFGASLEGKKEDGSNFKLELPLVVGNVNDSFETKRIAFKLNETITNVKIKLISNNQYYETIIDFVLLQEAQESSAEIQLEDPITNFYSNGQILCETKENDNYAVATTYEYDSNGNITSITDQNGVTRYYKYSNGILSEVGFTKDENGNIINPIEYTYSATGLLQNIYKTTGVILQEDDTSTSDINEEVLEDLLVSYTYNNDKVSSITYNDTTYTFDYNTNGNVKKIILNGETENKTLVENVYNSDNLTVNYANGYSDICTLNDGLITSLKRIHENSIINEYTYTYNSSNKLVSIYDGSNITTNFTDTGYTVSYKVNGISYEIYSKTTENGVSTEKYYSSIFKTDDTPTETNVSSPVTISTDSSGNTTYSQTLTAHKESSFTGNSQTSSLDYSTQLETIYDYFDRITSSTSTLGLTITDAETANNFETEVKETYSYELLSESTAENNIAGINITGNNISEASYSIFFNNNLKETDINLFWCFDYYPNGKIKLISYSESENSTYIPMTYYEYDEFDRLSLEFSLMSHTCIKYSYDTNNNLSTKSKYLTTISDNLFEEYFIKYLKIKNAITNTDIVEDPDFNEYTIFNGEAVSTVYTNHSQHKNAVSSVEVNGTSYTITNDNLGQPTNYVFENHDGSIVTGTCTWTGTLLTAFETDSAIYEYTYDVNGYRTSKTTYSTTNNSKEYENTIFYNWEDGILQGIHLIDENSFEDSNDNEVIEKGEANAFYTDIIYDANNSPIAIQAPSGAQYIFVKDALGNIIALTDVEGTMICNLYYDAFGNVELELNGSDLLEDAIFTVIAMYNPCTYQGALYDYETGLYFTQGRCYSPYWGRYLNISNYDSLVFVTDKLGNEPYTFCKNDPINNQDIICQTTRNTVSNDITEYGFKVDMSSAYLSKTYCNVFAEMLIKSNGQLNSAGEYVYCDMTVERIASNLFARSVGRYCEETLNRVNSVWGDGWLYNNRNATKINVNKYDTYASQYLEIWNSAEALRKYSANKGVYIGL